MSNTSEFSKITGSIPTSDGANIRDALAAFAEMSKIMKTLTENGYAFQSSMRKSTELLSQDFYVRKDMLAAAQKGLGSVATAHAGMKDTSPISYSSPSDVSMTSFTRKIEDKRARARVNSELRSNGGRMSENAKQGYYDITVPEVENYRTTKTGDNISLAGSVKNVITDSNRDFRKNEEAAKAAKLFELQKKEAEKKAAAEEKAALKFHEAQQKRSKELFEGNVKSMYQKRIDDEGKKETGPDKGQDMKGLKTIGVLFAVVKVIEKILDVGKQIYNALIGMAGKAMAAITTGMSLGMSATAILAQRNFARMKGMDEGIFEKSQSSVQNKFGNITSLDTGALEKLALVLGGDISRLVKSGLGGEDPDKLLDMIITGFQKKALSGVNSLGQQVGVAEALREMASYLGKIDANWATIFTRKAYDAMNPNATAEERAAAEGTLQQWEAGAITNPMSINANDIALAASIKNLADTVAGLWKAVEEGVMVKLAGSLGDFMNNLKNVMYMFLSPEAKKEVDLTNRAQNESRLTEMEDADKALTRQSTTASEKLIKMNPAYKDNAKLDEDLERLAFGQAPKYMTDTSRESFRGMQELYGIQQGKKLINEKRNTIAGDMTKSFSYNESFLLQAIEEGSDWIANRLAKAGKGNSVLSDYTTDNSVKNDVMRINDFENRDSPAGAEAYWRKTSDKAMVNTLIQQYGAQIIGGMSAEARAKLTPDSKVELSVKGETMTVIIKDTSGNVLGSTKTLLNIAPTEGSASVGDFFKDFGSNSTKPDSSINRGAHTGKGAL